MLSETEYYFVYTFEFCTTKVNSVDKIQFGLRQNLFCLKNSLLPTKVNSVDTSESCLSQISADILIISSGG